MDFAVLKKYGRERPARVLLPGFVFSGFSVFSGYFVFPRREKSRKMEESACSGFQGAVVKFP